MTAPIPSFILARWFGVGRPGGIRLIVRHSTESPCDKGRALKIAQMFHTETRKSSAHAVVDDNATITTVHDQDQAWAAPGSNGDGIHLEHCGYAAWSRAAWLEHEPMIRRGAQWMAQMSHAHGIPLVELSVAQVRDRKTKGVCDHRDVTKAFGESTHTDPGSNFPEDLQLQWAREYLDAIDGAPTWAYVGAGDIAASVGRAVPGRANVYTVCARRGVHWGQVAHLNPHLDTTLKRRSLKRHDRLKLHA